MNQLILKNLDTALHILSHFTNKKKTWGVRELAKELDISHTIVYRILSTYEKHGIIQKNTDTSKYQLGMKLLEYGLVIKESFGITDIILPIMKRLSEETQETIFLTWLDGDEGVCLEIAESTQKVKLTATVGSRTKLYAGAWGKAIMAFLPDEIIEANIAQGIEQITSKTIVSPEKLKENLRDIKEQGWCYSVGEYADNTTGIAIPLFNGNNQVIASIAVGGPDYRIGPERVDNIIKYLIKGRDEIQKYLLNLPITYTLPPTKPIELT